MTDCGVVDRTSSLGENHVGVPGCDVVGSAAVEIAGAQDGTCTGAGQSAFGGAAGRWSSEGAHEGRSEAAGVDSAGGAF